ncbi:MAG: 2-succinyl-5-enolpyruvyl-6-hydroxy-3-cyclohexene-carboxylate synthase [Solirubrobacteraceae bacterium]|nr:2-succinyl-5-enolpyruvyl-6-hydroxy-3-cyclohexene-carboxylate synthase [Solirubrobacteraceae bacterium]
MTAIDTYTGLRAFADELGRCGVRFACTSPGSRSTPLVLSLARTEALTTSSHVDERSGAFFALGTAKATGVPAVLACTSGTAAANYLPAVIEAHEARVPLVVLTADRPPELRDTGAGQTIDQVKLYGRAAKWYLEVDEAPATPERMRFLRGLACRAVWTALAGRPGPVHLNFALREPLTLGEDDDLPRGEPGGGGRRDGKPWVQHTAAPQAPAGLDLRAKYPVLVAGRLENPADGAAAAAFATRNRWPLLADPLSGARRGDAAIAHYDALLRVPKWGEGFEPDLVVRVGDLPTSKPLRQWLAGLPRARQIALDPEGAWQDPDHVIGEIHELRPGQLAAEPVDERWLAGWRAADAVAREAMGRVLGGELSEPAVAVRTAAQLGPGDALVVASSMPVRDLETFAVTGARVICNRGANGIDGTASTALGVAAAHRGRTVLLTGDVALLHDVGGLIGPHPAPLTIVLINNDGGGIFSFLPVAAETDHFERLVATPRGVDFAQVAALAGFNHRTAADPPAFDAALAAALGSNTIVEVRTSRADNVTLHRRVWAAVTQAIQRA